MGPVVLFMCKVLAVSGVRAVVPLQKVTPRVNEIGYTSGRGYAAGLLPSPPEVFKLRAFKMAKVCSLYTTALFFLKYFFLGVHIVIVYKS